MSSSTAQQLHVDPSSLRKVHDLLKNNIGAVHSLFARGPKPNTHNIRDLVEDTCAQYNLDDNGKVAALYLFTLGRVKGTETAEYTQFLNVLRHPCPKPPSDSDAFLPYMSFLVAPDRKKCVRDDRLIDSKQYDPSDNGLIMPPHPANVEKPSPFQRYAFPELSTLLQRAGSSVTCGVFTATLKDVDRGVSSADAKRLFTEGFIVANMKGKIDEKTSVPVAALLEVCKPQLTMERQKMRSSTLVKGAFSWDVPSPPSPTKGGSSPRRSGGNSPRSPRNALGAQNQNGGSRSSSSSSARRGFQPTRSAELRASLAKEHQSDPTSPFYNKGVYKHIPAVPESHYKKQQGLGLTSKYAVSGSSTRLPALSPRSRAAAEEEQSGDHKE